MTWGYDSGIFQLDKLVSQITPETHTDNLLGDLVYSRVGPQVGKLSSDPPTQLMIRQRSRPILFNGHDIGGLIIKNVSRLALSLRSSSSRRFLSSVHTMMAQIHVTYRL